MSIYLCQTCDRWYKTKEEWKNHPDCKPVGKNPPAYFQRPKDDSKEKGMINTVPTEIDGDVQTAVISERPDLIAELKSKEIIKDARSVRSKSDQDLREMLKSEE